MRLVQLFFWFAMIGCMTILLLKSFGAPPMGVPASTPRPLAGPALLAAASGVLPLGGISVTLPVSVSNVVNLGALSADLAYDNRQVAPVHCRINRPLFDLGLCNLAYDSDGDGWPDAVRFNATALNGVSIPAGAPLPAVAIAWQVTGTAQVDALAPLTLPCERSTMTRGCHWRSRCRTVRC